MTTKRVNPIAKRVATAKKAVSRLVKTRANGKISKLRKANPHYEYDVYAPGRGLVQGVVKAISKGSARRKVNKEYGVSKAKITGRVRNSPASDFVKHQKVKLQSLAEMFHGEHKGERTRIAESDYTPRDKYKLGYLIQLKVKDGGNGKIIPINFDGEHSYLTADLRNNLHIVGKDSRLTNFKLPPVGHLKYLGQVQQIDYVTAKKHIGNGKLIRFFHKLGEVTRERPNLFVDHEGFLQMQGGGYDVWEVGIVN